MLAAETGLSSPGFCLLAQEFHSLLGPKNHTTTGSRAISMPRDKGYAPKPKPPLAAQKWS